MWGLGQSKNSPCQYQYFILLDILEGCFGHKDLDTSQSTISLEEPETETTTEDVASNIPEKTSPTLPTSGSLATAQLVFPLKLVPTVIAGIPKSFLPVHGLETLSLYCYQYPSCTLEFSQKAAACNHVWPDHLNIALACLYCSVEHSPKLCWYNASAWEHHTLTHSRETFPFIQMILPFHNNLLMVLVMELYHLPLDLYWLSLMLLLFTNKQKLPNIS